MMNYGPFYVLYKLRKLRSQVAYLLGAYSHLNVVVNNSAQIIVRDAPSDPEPPPANAKANAFLTFRNDAASKVWDAEAETPSWI